MFTYLLFRKINSKQALRVTGVNQTSDQVIFVQNDVFHILVEFESDRISPRESAKKCRNGAHGFNYKNFFNSELIFEIYDKNYPMLKNSMPLRHF